MLAAAPRSDEIRRSEPVRLFNSVRQSFDATEAPDVVHITVGRALDLVGRPVSPIRQIRSAWPASSNAIAGLIPPASFPLGSPVAARAITSRFGQRVHPLLGGLREHRGVDIAASAGSPVIATSDGVASIANWFGGYGLCVALEHGGGLQTRYGHLSRLNIVAGQRVRRGDVIGFVGSTGLSTGPHLHYEVRLRGQAIDPASLLGLRLAN